MPIFNLGHFNSDNVFRRLVKTSTPSTYSNIKLWGEGNFAMLHGLKYQYTDSQIGDEPFLEDESWGLDTFILAKFRNDLQAGNLTSLPAPLDKLIVFRKTLDESKATKIAELNSSDTTYVDRLASSNESYIYQVIAKAGESLSDPLQTIPVETDFNKVILLNPNTTEGYSFCYDLRLTGIETQEDISFNDTRGSFPTYLKGNRRFHTGTVGVLLNSNSITEPDLRQDIELLKSFEDFILSGEEKIIKFPKGFSYRVITSNFSKIKKNSVDNNGNSIYVVSFDYTEVGGM